MTDRDTLDEPAGAPTTAATFRAREREAEAFRLRESVEAGLRSCGYAAGDDGGTIEMTLSALQRFFEDERRRDLDLKLTLAALRHVTRAANDRDRAALATVEGHVQPVVDAFMGWVQARQEEERIAELEGELRANAAMLARQCDLARQAEIERDEVRAELDEMRNRSCYGCRWDQSQDRLRGCQECSRRWPDRWEP